MANNNLEKYLEAILDKIADGTETDIPRPSWNIEKYLAAIYEALSSGSGGSGGSDGGSSTGGGVLVVHDVDGTLDKTWNEIDAADVAVVVASVSEYGDEMHYRAFVTSTEALTNGTHLVLLEHGSGDTTYYGTRSADGFPALAAPSGGGGEQA